MALKLYNSLGKKFEDFSPLKEKQVLIYVCGITPYDTTHLGHAFTYVSYDVLIRYLEYLGYKVSYTQNITDIDDDILKKAGQTGRDWQELGEFWTQKFLSDMASLNWRKPDNYVKATNSIQTIVKIITKLLDKGYAYKSENVYFDVSKFKKYGELSEYNISEMIEISAQRGADPEDPNKKNPLDFVLWQTKKEGEPSWQAPFGEGRPGWHIECSSMIYDTLGSQIDIHGGGYDLVYPHHESEIAQSESYTNKAPFVKYWVHTAMTSYKNEKMAKSLGNLVMVSDLLKNYTGNAIRWLLLSHHYREEWEYTDEMISQAQNSVDFIDKVLKSAENTDSLNKPEIDKFESLMNDDLKTPQVLELVVEIANKIDKASDNNTNLKKTLLHILSNLGFVF